MKNERLTIDQKNILHAELNKLFKWGSLALTIFGFFCAAFLLIIKYVFRLIDPPMPMIWAIVISSIFFFILHILAKNNMIRGNIQYLVIFCLSSLPTFIILSSFFSDKELITRIYLSPTSIIYFIIIISSGLFLDFKISVITGIITAIEYIIVSLIIQGDLAEINSLSTNNMLEGITSLPSTIVRSVLMLFSGIVMGIFAENSKRLILKIVFKEKENQNIDRLFGEYVSVEVKDKLISQTKNISGERKKLVVLFSDIRSFTTLSENIPPAIVVEQLNEFFDRMVRIINVNGGVIDKFIGDAIMATFGGFIELQNPCDNALDSSMNMILELEKLNKKWETEGLTQLKIGIGLDYGEVIQGSIGSKTRKDYTVIGDVVNTASRLETSTKEYSFNIIFSENFYLSLNKENQVKANEIGEIKVKGKDNKLKAYGI